MWTAGRWRWCNGAFTGGGVGLAWAVVMLCPTATA